MTLPVTGGKVFQFRLNQAVLAVFGQLAGIAKADSYNEAVITVESLTAKFRAILPLLDERQLRLYLASEAISLGRGGISIVSKAAGVTPERVSRGVAELESGVETETLSVRRKGAGRKSYRESNPELVLNLLNLVAPSTRGDPMSPLLWTTKSTRKLALELKRCGHIVSHEKVAQILREEGYSLQANVKTREGKQHEDRDAQFVHINNQSKEFLASGKPVLSIDCKKKELVGNFKNGGREWEPKGQPIETNVHDFKDKELGKAIPYGIYDVGRNEGWMNVGCDHDTAEFAVNGLRTWFNSPERQAAYPGIREVYLCMDGGGSNAWRSRLWKDALVKFSLETGLTIRVSHLPPGTSKWNKIEHRLFSHITMNWRGRPLTSHEVIIESLKATTTATGLRVHAQLDTGKYPTGKKITDEELVQLSQFITRDEFHGEWNYTITPLFSADKAKKRD